MLLSTNTDTPGYDEWLGLMAEGKSITVLLDGTEQDKVTVVDDEAGYIIRLVTDESGSPVPNGDYLQHECLTGKVEIHIE